MLSHIYFTTEKKENMRRKGNETFPETAAVGTVISLSITLPSV